MKIEDEPIVFCCESIDGRRRAFAFLFKDRRDEGAVANN
jgi:hypothetical protein